MFKYYVHLYDPNIENTEYKYINYADLDSIKKSSCSEIFINDLLEYLSEEEASKCLDKIKTKLSKKGLIHIQNIDLKGFCLNIAYDRLNSLKELLISKNLVISKVRFLNGINFYIECTKFHE